MSSFVSCCVLYCIICTLPGCKCTYTQYWKSRTIDGFVANTLQTLQRGYSNKIWIPHQQHKYSITDCKRIGNATISLVNFPLSTSMEISSCRVRVGIQSASPNSADGFDVSLNYISDHALIRKFAASPPLNALQTMLLMDYILLKMRMKSATMYNTVCQRYQHRGTTRCITSIEIRCINGKTTDWLSDFGYFNDHRQLIANEMRKVHDLQIEYGPCYRKRKASLGAALMAIWVHSPKVQFYDFHHQFRTLFYGLIALRGGHWNKRFHRTAPSMLRSLREPTNPTHVIDREHNRTVEIKQVDIKTNKDQVPLTNQRSNPLDARSRPDSAWSSLSPW